MVVDLGHHSGSMAPSASRFSSTLASEPPGLTPVDASAHLLLGQQPPSSSSASRHSDREHQHHVSLFFPSISSFVSKAFFIPAAVAIMTL